MGVEQKGKVTVVTATGPGAEHGSKPPTVPIAPGEVLTTLAGQTNDGQPVLVGLGASGVLSVDGVETPFGRAIRTGKSVIATRP